MVIELTRALLGASVAVAVGVAVLSGPLAADLDPGSDDADTGELGYGSAEVTVLSVPDTVWLVEGEGDESTAGQDLRVPPATVRVEGVERRPSLVYKLRVPALGYARSTTQFLDADSEGRRQLTIDGGSVSGALEQGRYEGELLVALRSGADQRVLERRNVTVVVER